MPTTAKLVAAVIFALIGWLAANAHIPSLGENPAIGRFREISALIGVVVGWSTMGSLVGKGYADAVGSGLRTSVTLVFFALLIFSTVLMFRETARMTYAGPMEAVLGVFQIMLDHGRRMLVPGVLGVLIVGGALGGVLTEWAARRWR